MISKDDLLNSEDDETENSWPLRNRHGLHVRDLLMAVVTQSAFGLWFIGQLSYRFPMGTGWHRVIGAAAIGFGLVLATPAAILFGLRLFVYAIKQAWILQTAAGAAILGIGLILAGIAFVKRPA